MDMDVALTLKRSINYHQRWLRAHGGMGTIIDDHFLCSPKTNGVDGLLPGRAAGFINNNTEKHVNTHRTHRTVWPVRTAVCLAGGPSVCLSATH